MKVFGLFSGRRKGAGGDAPLVDTDHEAPSTHAAGAAEPEPEAAPHDEAAHDDDHAAFEDEFESAFESAAPSTADSGREEDAAANRELFVGIASRQARPVKNFVRQLQRGSTGKDLIDMCRPVLSSTLEAAEGIQLDNVAKCLNDLDDALQLAQADDSAEVDGDARDLILSCYEELEAQLPEAFALSEADSERDAIIVHSLLRQIPDVGHVTLDRLYSAGFTSIDVLTQASQEDLAVTTGIRAELAERICDYVQRHHEAMWGLQTEQLPAMLRERLGRETEELRKLHVSFEATAAAEVNDASLGDRKRKLRRQRQAAACRVELTLAELDELDLLAKTQKLTFGRRIETIEEFLSRPHRAPAQGG